jgi:hypothetical protein
VLDYSLERSLLFKSLLIWELHIPGKSVSHICLHLNRELLMQKSDSQLWTALIGLGILIGSITSTAIAIEPIQTSRLCRPQVGLLPTNVAVILKTPSTNNDCKRFLVAPSGKVSFVIGDKTGQGMIKAPLINKFFRDVKAAEPLSKLPIKLHCVKSASFGTSTFVSLDREKSPDLSCPGNAKAKQLFEDSTAILGEFH